MKFRTDFVTNSSDTSYLAFNIKNSKLWDYLTSLGIKFENSDKGVFSDSTQITLPSGIKGCLCEEPKKIPVIFNFQSISEWLVSIFKHTYDWLDDTEDSDDYDEIDNYENNEEDDEEYDEDKPIKMWEAFVEELSQIITPDVEKTVASMDDSIEKAHIEYEEGFEGVLYSCEAVDINNGVRTVTTPEKDFFYANDLSEFDFDGEPGEVITQKWINGRWVTTSKKGG